MCRVTIDHNNTILGGDDFNEDNPETIVFVRLIARCNIEKDRRRTNALSMASSKSVQLVYDKT